MDKSAESLGEALEQCASIPGVTPISPRVVGRMRVIADIDGFPGVVLLDAVKTLPPGDYELVARTAGVTGTPAVAYTWPPKACPCRSLQCDDCQENGCKWERDPSLVPVALRTPGVKVPAPAGHIMSPPAYAFEWRTCEFCGCHTNAKVRNCCEHGFAADRYPLGVALPDGAKNGL